MKPRLVPIRQRIGISPPPRPQFGIVDGGGKTAVWDVRKSLAVLHTLQETKPEKFSPGFMLWEALKLATKLLGEGKHLVQVQVLGERMVRINKQPKVFVLFNYKDQELQLCSSHFVNDGVYSLN